MSDSHATLIDEIQRLKERLAAAMAALEDAIRLREEFRRMYHATVKERDAANTERSAVIAENHSLHEINTKIQVEHKAAESALAQAREALKRYGKHELDCKCWRCGEPNDYLTCSCGLRTALSPAPAAEQAKCEHEYSDEMRYSEDGKWRCKKCGKPSASDRKGEGK